MPPFKVLVVGGGIAGPAIAHWLSRIGASITLIERSSQMRASGQQVDLRGQGVEIMKKMGIESTVRSVLVREPGMQLIGTDGQVKAYFPAAENGNGRQSITSEFEIMRGDLVKILYELTENKPNVKHLYDTTIETFTQDAESDPSGKVHVTFKDGHKEDFDFLVAADGTGSKTRKIMLGPEAVDPRHSQDGYIGYFSVPSKPGDSKNFNICFLPGSMARMIGTRKDCEDLTRVYMITRGKDANLDKAQKSGNLAELKKALASLYEDGGWECARFMDVLKNSPVSDDLYFTPIQEVRLPKGDWSRGRVALLGDAAHSGTANGVGTSWGLVGAYVLAGEIATLLKAGSTPTAAVSEGAKTYEEKFRPIATATHGGNEWVEDLLLPRSRFGIWVLHTVARAAAYFKLDQLGGIEGKTAKWQLPEYPALDEKHD